MASLKAKADLTKGPTLDVKNPGKTVMDGLMYAVGVGFMIFLIGVGTRFVAPLFSNVTSAVTGGRVSSGDDPLGGVWEDLR